MPELRVAEDWAKRSKFYATDLSEVVTSNPCCSSRRHRQNWAVSKAILMFIRQPLTEFPPRNYWLIWWQHLIIGFWWCRQTTNYPPHCLQRSRVSSFILQFCGRSHFCSRKQGVALTTMTMLAERAERSPLFRQHSQLHPLI